MPSLGKPTGLDANNPYREIQKYRGPNDNSGQLQKMVEMDKGEFLNNIVGKNGQVGKSAIKVVDGTKHGKLDKDGFLKLLMHQLSNQNPMKPVDQNKMAADLAQFSQLEQISNMNKNLEKVLADDIVKKKFFAASFLGKKVMTNGSSVKHYGEGSSSSINFKIPKDMAKGLIRIFDSQKQMITQLNLDARPAGTHSISWDGKQLDGMDAGKGVYTVQIKAWDRFNNEISAKTQAKGLVTGVSFDRHGEPVVTVDDKKVYLRDVENFQLVKNNQEKEMANKAYQRAQKEVVH